MKLKKEIIISTIFYGFDKIHRYHYLNISEDCCNSVDVTFYKFDRFYSLFVIIRVFTLEYL